MQIIYEMINLQLNQFKDPNVLNILKGTQRRIKSMALVHNSLYRSKNLSRIEFKNYVQTLVLNLYNSFGVDSNSIGQKIDVRNIYLDISTAIPCGLIISELVSNSLKHAFPRSERRHKENNSKGEIYVRLSSDRNNNFTLIVRDDGVGFPKDLDFRNTKSLGLQIVNTLVKQLEGEIELKKEKGTFFKIEFTP